MNTLTIDFNNAKTLEDNQDLLNHPKAIALGYFDGMHRGHQEIIRQMVEVADSKNIESTVLSFDRYPKPVPESTYLNAVVPGTDTDDALLDSPLKTSEHEFLGLLQSKRQAAHILDSLGVENFVLQVFDKAYADMSPHEFCYRVLSKVLNCKALFVGANYKFAKDQAGDIDFLKQWAKDMDVDLHVVSAVSYDNKPISSSRIREDIKAGNLSEATSLLGRPYTLPGVVIEGQALGRTIGVPTANIRLAHGMVKPVYGVYESRTIVDGVRYNSLTSIGLRPTVNHTDPYPLVESYLIDQDIDLYGKYVEVELLKYKRAEERFPSFISMAAQIETDLEKTIHFHNNTEDFYLFTVENKIPFYLSHAERFNTSRLNVNVYLPYNPDTFINNILLANLVTATTEDYPTKPSLNAYLESQYSASINTSSDIIANTQEIKFNLTAVNQNQNNDSFRNSAKLFTQMLISPNWDQFYNFPEELIAAEKQNLIFEISQNRIERDRVSIYQAKQYLEKENTKKNLADTFDDLIEKVKNVSKVDLQRAWMDIFTRGHIQVLMSGKFNDYKFTKDLVSAFNKLPRVKNPFYIVPGKGLELKHLEPAPKANRFFDTELTHLVLVYNNLPNAKSVDELLGYVFTALVSNSPSAVFNYNLSKNLQYVYDLDINYDPFSASLALHIEIKPEDRDRVVSIVNEAIDKIANNEYSEERLLSAIRTIENNLSSVKDNPSMRLDFANTRLISADKYSSKESLKFLRSIKREDINKLARNMHLVLDFALNPEEAKDLDIFKDYVGELDE